MVVNIIATPDPMKIDETIDGRFNTFVGIAGQKGQESRETVSFPYLDAMLRCKIVVEANPWYTGDWRTAEALASGALVLHAWLPDPYPTLRDGVNVVFFNNFLELLNKVRHYLQNPAEADRIAAESPSAIIPVSHVFDSLLDVVMGKGRSAKVFLVRREGMGSTEFAEVTVPGFESNPRVSLVDDYRVSDMVILDLWAFRTHPDPLVLDLVKDLENGTWRVGNTKIVAIDWQDQPRTNFLGVLAQEYHITDLRYMNSSFIDVIFKRARTEWGGHALVDWVNGQDKTWSIPVYGLYYPLKKSFKEEVEKRLTTSAPRSLRDNDVCIFFEPCATPIGPKKTVTHRANQDDIK